MGKIVSRFVYSPQNLLELVTGKYYVGPLELKDIWSILSENDLIELRDYPLDQMDKALNDCEYCVIVDISHMSEIYSEYMVSIGAKKDNGMPVLLTDYRVMEIPKKVALKIIEEEKKIPEEVYD